MESTNLPPKEGPSGSSFRKSFGVASQLAYEIVYLVDQETSEAGWDVDRIAGLVDELIEEAQQDEV